MRIRRLQTTKRGPNASCTIRPVLSVVASHLEMVPTNESHLLALCVRIGFGGEVRFSGETCRPPSEHQGRRPDSRASPVVLRLSTNVSNAERRNNLMGRSVVSVFDRKIAPYREFSRSHARSAMVEEQAPREH